MIKKLARIAVLLVLVVGITASFFMCFVAGMLAYYDRAIGETFIVHLKRDNPQHSICFVQVWSSGGGIRIMLGRMDHVVPEYLSDVRSFYEHGVYSPGPKPYPIERNLDHPNDHAIGNERFQYFRRDYDIGTYAEHFRSITAPAWLIVAATAIAPLLTLMTMVRKTQRALLIRRRRKHGLCLNCGYDLRHSLDRCPECGLGCKQDQPPPSCIELK
jgi:hypothetical protein